LSLLPRRGVVPVVIAKLGGNYVPCAQTYWQCCITEIVVMMTVLVQHDLGIQKEKKRRPDNIQWQNILLLSPILSYIRLELRAPRETSNFAYRWWSQFTPFTGSQNSDSSSAGALTVGHFMVGSFGLPAGMWNKKRGCG
jgi:hypothetical protein